MPDTLRSDARFCAADCRAAAWKRGQYKRHLKERYGMTLADWQRMFDSQEGRCAICRKPRELHVDHDHQTGAVRALLCSLCNTAIGKLGEDPDVLRAATIYLETHRAASSVYYAGRVLGIPRSDDA